ncbi:TPA: hypothetical protein HA251_05400 [Candidatus Woesearchaeota archaeon]|nr:hypothetical protein [Candidatus Woesearchaeota archaeon]
MQTPHNTQTLQNADLHTHTTASNDHVQWHVHLPMKPLLTPVDAYTLAKRRGMDYVTFTDHDTIDGATELERHYGKLPDDFFTSVEITSGLPGYEHEVHVNAFGINARQHKESQRLRPDARELTAYLKSEGVLYAWNHPVWNESNRPLDMQMLETLLPFFSVIEVRNGTRRKHLCDIAESLAERGHTARVAGSDSHSAEIGLTYTTAPAACKEEYLASIRAGLSEPRGQYGTFPRFVRDVTLIGKENLLRMARKEHRILRRVGLRALARSTSVIVPPIVYLYHRGQDRSLAKVTIGTEAY